MVWLTGPGGKKFAAEVADGEKTLRFAPAGKAWPAGRYKLVIDTRLEDPCGNRVGRAFEAGPDAAPATATRVRFTVR